jgi:peptide/nickel transport system substrate-binding protein
LNDVLQTPDGPKRQALFDQLHELFLHDVPMLMLANGIDVSVTNANIEGYRTWNGFTRLWGVAVKK